MAQIRIAKENNFTVFEDELLQSPNWSLKAKGLLAYMLSLPDDWDYSIAGLSIMCKEGKASMRSAINELMAEGYVTRCLARDDKGMLTGYEYVVYERPHPSCENKTTVEGSAEPSCENLTSENPTSGNRTQQRNNKQRTKEQNTPHPPTGGGARAKRSRQDGPKSAPDWKPERFAKFWTYYPRGENKQRAIRAWDNLRPSDELIDTMARALARQKATEEWQRGIGIPHASTWINGRRWEDEVRRPAAQAETAPSLTPERFGWD